MCEKDVGYFSKRSCPCADLLYCSMIHTDNNQCVWVGHTFINSKLRSSSKLFMKVSATVEITTFSSDDGGREGAVTERWTPMAEAMMKGIFNRLIVHHDLSFEPALNT